MRYKCSLRERRENKRGAFLRGGGDEQMEIADAQNVAQSLSLSS